MNIPREKHEGMTDADELHMEYVRKNGLPTIQRVCELKVKLEANVLSARAVGGSAPDALDTLSVLNTWLMIHTDRRYMDAFLRVTSVKVEEPT